MIELIVGLSLLATVLVLALIDARLKLSATRAELERAHRRMHRLDELAEDIVDRECEEPVTMMLEDEREPTADILERDSGQFIAAGLVMETDEAHDELDVEIPPGIKQKPGRMRHLTPLGSPANTMLPHAADDSVVAIGSVQVRLGEITERAEQR